MGALAWIERAPGAPYFVTETGDPWTPVGQNDAITWPELAGLWRRRDLDGVERHLRTLRDCGVTVLRLMLEYCHKDGRYFERRVGVFNPLLIRLWDDLFALCERVGMRVLLTPFDTFFLWNRWRRHPYNAANGGPCEARSQLLLCPRTRDAIKGRLAFASSRWGGSGALFAWDIWNEMHPAVGDNEPGCFADYIADVAPFLREHEIRAHGRAHPQCVSIFGPELGWKPWLNEPIFRHPALDFANSHFYEEGTIDHPADTVAPAVAVGRLVQEALSEIVDDRPFFDSEHGPIHTFKDFRRTLPEPFDDEYFRHIQWAHLASGGAGGGMRWPNRHPHLLTAGMRKAQAGMAGFLPLIDWPRFRRRNITDGIEVETAIRTSVSRKRRAVVAFGCADPSQAVVWLLRQRPLASDGRVSRERTEPLRVAVPGLAAGSYKVTRWHTEVGHADGEAVLDHPGGGPLPISIDRFTTDLALAVVRMGGLAPMERQYCADEGGSTHGLDGRDHQLARKIVGASEGGTKP